MGETARRRFVQWPPVRPVAAWACFAAFLGTYLISELGLLLGLPCLGAAIWLTSTRGPVDQYLASRPRDALSRWERWYPMESAGYFRFHAQPVGVRAWPYLWATRLLMAGTFIGGVAALAKIAKRWWG
jgi:hypothetical protein